MAPEATIRDDITGEDLEQVKTALGSTIQKVIIDRGQVTLVVAGADARKVITALRDNHTFNFPVDVTAVDYSEWIDEDEHSERFAVVYHLLSLEKNIRIRIRAMVSELTPQIESLHDLYGCFDMAEREVYDMFGIEFTGHPNMTRILCPDNMLGHALRKDYPLTGRGEREDFPVWSTDEESRT